MPPFPNYSEDTANDGFYHTLYVLITIPTGASLDIRDLQVLYDDVIYRPANSGVQIDTHGAFMFYPQHTLAACEAAAKCGATRCIVIPKRSSDGVWFAYHDDTMDYNSTILRTPSGERPAYNAEYAGKRFSAIPWSYLKDFYVYRAPDYNYASFQGEKLMLIKDFFMLCNKTGMKPMFSLHPVLYTSEYEDLYNFAKKYGVLSQLAFKIDNPEAFPVLKRIFGNDIDSYGFVLGRGENEHTDAEVQRRIDILDNAQTGDDPLDKTKVSMFIEMWADQVTEQQVNMITNAGYIASIFAMSHVSPDGQTYPYLESAYYDYWVARGVTQFGENHNPSMGLNW